MKKKQEPETTVKEVVARPPKKEPGEHPLEATPGPPSPRKQEAPPQILNQNDEGKTVGQKTQQAIQGGQGKGPTEDWTIWDPPLGSPLGLGREAGTKRFKDTAGSQEEEEVLGLCSPTWELEGEDMQDNQVSDWEDIEAGDADPLILKEEDEKMRHRERPKNKKPPPRTNPPGRKREEDSWKGPPRKEQSFQAGGPGKGGGIGGRKPVKVKWTGA